MERPGSDALVPIATGYGFPETNVTVSYLRAYGIHAFAKSWHHASVSWHLTIALGGMQICVPRSQVETARELLTAIGDRNDDLTRPFARHAGLNACIAIAISLIFAVPPPARGFIAGGKPVQVQPPD